MYLISPCEDYVLDEGVEITRSYQSLASGRYCGGQNAGPAGTSVSRYPEPVNTLPALAKGTFQLWVGEGS